MSALIQSKDLRSVESVLRLIPSNCEESLHLMMDSGSLQPATPSEPRVILSCLDDSGDYAGRFNGLTLAFNTAPDFTNFNTLELFQYRKATQSFEFRQIEFSSDSPARISEKNPASCRDCHHQDPRPNWDPYFVWPGAYGMVDDAEAGASAREQLAEKALASQPRIALLDARPTLAQIQRIENNAELNAYFGPLNNERIVRKIVENPRLRPYRYAILGVLGCTYFPEDAKFIDTNLTEDDEDLIRNPTAGLLPQDFLPPALQKMRKSPLNYVESTFALQQANYVERVKSCQALGSSVKDRTLEFLDSRIFKAPESIQNKVAELRYLIEGAGVSMSDWSLAVDPHAYSFNNGNSGLEIYSGLVSRFLDPVRDADLIRMGMDDPTRDLCELLRKKSLSALR